MAAASAFLVMCLTPRQVDWRKANDCLSQLGLPSKERPAVTGMRQTSSCIEVAAKPWGGSHMSRAEAASLAPAVPTFRLVRSPRTTGVLHAAVDAEAPAVSSKRRFGSFRGPAGKPPRCSHAPPLGSARKQPQRLGQSPVPNPPMASPSPALPLKRLRTRRPDEYGRAGLPSADAGRRERAMPSRRPGAPPQRRSGWA